MTDTKQAKRSYLTAIFGRYGSVTLEVKVMNEDGEWESTLSMFLEDVKEHGPFCGNIELGYVEGVLRPLRTND